MKTLLFLSCFALCASPLSAMQKTPWLGNLFEFEGTIFQEYTESKHLDTSHGDVKKHLHSNLTRAKISFMPLEDLLVGIESDFNETQKHSYGFDALKGQVTCQLLNDLQDDNISLITSFKGSISPHSRVHDLSSQNHGHVEGALAVCVGREFWDQENSFWRAWAEGFSGLADKGAPWLGAEVHIEKVFFDRHHISCFYRAEVGLSHHHLKSARDFHSWAQVGYRFDEVGVRYTLKEFGYGSCVVEVKRRVHARFCPSHSWTIQVGLIIPFSPW